MTGNGSFVFTWLGWTILSVLLVGKCVHVLLIKYCYSYPGQCMVFGILLNIIPVTWMIHVPEMQLNSCIFYVREFSNWSCFFFLSSRGWGSCFLWLMYKTVLSGYRLMPIHILGLHGVYRSLRIAFSNFLFLAASFVFAYGNYPGVKPYVIPCAAFKMSQLTSHCFYGQFKLSANGCKFHPFCLILFAHLFPKYIKSLWDSHAQHLL